LSLTLVRGGSERLATALVTSLPEWATYVESAPQLRTSRLVFLVERSGETWIMGTPLPPLSGVRCYELDGLFVPAGFVWSPAVDSQTVRLSLGLAADEVAMFEIDGAWRRAARTEFVKGSRAAIRATLARSAHAGL
jgi:hypothetical protein